MLKGLKGLLANRKTVLALIVLASATALCAYERIDGQAYSAIVQILFSGGL